VEAFGQGDHEKAEELGQTAHDLSEQAREASRQAREKAVNNLADSSRRNRHKADSSRENTQVDSRRVVNKGSDDLELGLSVTKNKPAGVGALLSGAQGWRITE